jgi:hypothetical protein
LDADATAVDDSDFADAGLAALIDVPFDDARNILGREGMEIDSVLYRKDNRLVKLRVGRLRNGTTVGSVSLSHRILFHDLHGNRSTRKSSLCGMDLAWFQCEGLAAQVELKVAIE